MAHRLSQLVGSGTSVFQAAGPHPLRGHRRIDTVDFVFAPDLTELKSIEELEATALDPGSPTFVLSDRLELDVDKTKLTTSLVGREEYVAALKPDRLEGSYVHISSRLPAGYRREWDELMVIGGGLDAGVNGTDLVSLRCRSDGKVLQRTLSPNRLGLQALDGVGSQRAHMLRNAGFETRAAVANGPVTNLAEIDGLARTTAEQIHQSATAVVGDRVIRKSANPLPGRNPLYIDIETDGLDPRIVWLIGVLDGSPTNGTYHSFLQRDPDEPGGALIDFLDWYQSHGSKRPVVAYNGQNFDFQVLRDQLITHAHSYLNRWQEIDTFDPYQWAITENNAILPGRTNKLKDVSDALGFEGMENNLTGAAVARAYSQWMADQSPASELAWDRFVSYCEGDVRRLASVYRALEDSSRFGSETDERATIEESTTQGALSDW
ncbi:MAG: ribonuclease H-like domain-containing protein [Halodesulfurarchaeum sp.]|nr:ribonuclease H-like domain-containing protein [Halodesulfurarchaeum sp.]